MKVSCRSSSRTPDWSPAGVSAAAAQKVFAQGDEPAGENGSAQRAVALVDTNVHLFEWPFRRLKYSRAAPLAEKLRRHGVKQAWAGTFEGLLSKEMSGVNARLAEECRSEGQDFFVPFGSVNPMWPGWEEDVRRCHEVHRMPGLRVYPGFHGYSLEHPEFARLLRVSAARGLLVQIALGLEDPRVQHPQIKAPVVTPLPLVAVLKEIPDARVQLLNSWQWTRQAPARALLAMPNVSHDLAELEGVGGVGRMLEGKHWYFGGQVPLEQVLFGSNAPYFPVEAALIRMFESPLTFAQMQAIMETNAKRLIARA